MASFNGKILTAEDLGTQVVVFHVGAGTNNQLLVHRNLLKLHSHIFNEAYEKPTGQFLAFLKQAISTYLRIDAHTGSIILPKPQFHYPTFQTLVTFLYTGTLPEEMTFMDLFKLYESAYRIGVRAVTNKIIDRFQSDHISKTRKPLKVDEIASIYNHRTIGDGVLWRYTMAHIAGRLFWGRLKEDWAQKFKEFWHANPGAMDELFDFQIKYAKEIQITEAGNRRAIKGDGFGPCAFHLHGEGKTCEDEFAAAIPKKQVKKRKAAEEAPATSYTRQKPKKPRFANKVWYNPAHPRRPVNSVPLGTRVDRERTESREASVPIRIKGEVQD